MENYTVFFFLIVSTLLVLGGIIYGFKMLKLVRLDKLWTTAWVFFILMLAVVLVRRATSYVFCIDDVLEQFIVLIASIAFFSFGYFIHKFFKKYLNNGPK
jgi:hypothetical protein